MPPRAARSGSRGVGAPVLPLSGFSIAIAADRRAHPITKLLDAAGARTTQVRAVRVTPQPDPDELRRSVDRVLEGPVDELVVSSALGFRAWLAAAGRAGVAERLIGVLGQSRLLARDAAAADSLREVGLREIWSTSAASTEDLFRYLLAFPTPGARAVVEVNTPALHDLGATLRAKGVEVLEIPTYRTAAPPHAETMRKLNEQLGKGQLDALVLANRPAAEYVLADAKANGDLNELLNVLVGQTLTACLGGFTAEPLRALGLDPLVGPTGFVEDLVANVVARLRARAIRLAAGSRRLEVRGQAVLVDGSFVLLPPGPLGVLQVLARRAGRVVSFAEIKQELPGWSEVNDHAVEMAVSRLRRHLGGLDGLDIVQTVVKRGYRLAAEPVADTDTTVIPPATVVTV
jgi:uroporphyrinogen-III synthase